jgi:two-component system response regulator VanR
MNRKSISYKVLVAEDNQVIAEAISKILTDIHIEATIVGTGKELLAEYNNDYYDMVLLDILMPDMDGFDASAKIRTVNTTIPIVAFTCLTYVEIQDKMAQSGINHYIGKPEELEQLRSLVLDYFNVAA